MIRRTYADDRCTAKQWAADFVSRNLAEIVTWDRMEYDEVFQGEMTDREKEQAYAYVHKIVARLRRSLQAAQGER